MLTSALKEILKSELASAISMPITSWESKAVGGGSINETWQITINKKEKYFCKVNSSVKFPHLFEKEKNGLDTLRSKHIFTVPNVILYTIIDKYQFLILEWVEPAQPADSFWESFGEQLAALHSITQEQFGWIEDNYMGALPQSNNAEKSWVDFFIYQRLQPQLKMAADNHLVNSKHLKAFESLYKNLPTIFPQEAPSLIHGDLWSGNFICNNMQEPVLIDPAICYGHRAMDLGMTTLFGGFENKFYNTYFEHSYLAENYKIQWELCNLYPLLVHVNLFGGSYINQVETILFNYC